MTIVAGLLISIILSAGCGFYAGIRRTSALWAKKCADLDILRTIVDHLPFALFAKSAKDNYTFLFLNKAAEHSFALKNDDVRGRTDLDFFPKPMAELFRAMDERVMMDGKLVDIDAEAIATARGTFTAHTIKVPIYTTDGKPDILLGILEDITEKSKVTERLLQAKDRAEQADRAKSEFLANMSHELRTPLNSILGMSRLLQESHIDGHQRELAQNILSSSNTLLEIVNDILDLSKIESGTMKLEEIGFDLSYIHNSLMQRMNPLALEKSLEPLKLIDSNPPYVCGDPLRLTRILTNLISNAIKYSERGQITINVSHSSPTATTIFYRCEVSDQGIGIPLEQHGCIFGKFMQADSSITRRYGGTGLGLAITKQLTELMGGGIGFWSEAGKGSTFWVEIPFYVSDHVHREKLDHRKLKKFSTLRPSEVNVLLAEDSRVNQVFVEKLMERFNITN